MSEAKLIKERWQDLYSQIMGAAYDTERDLVITPYFGHYGLDGYVITIQGSPIHGLAVLELARDRVTCIGSNKIVQTNNPYGQPGSKKKKLLKDATMELITLLGLPTEPGGRDNPAVYYLRAGVQEDRNAKK